jgi:hypothetical protein
MTTPSNSPEPPDQAGPAPDQPTGPTEEIPSQPAAAPPSAPLPAAAPSPPAMAPPAGPPLPPAGPPAGDPFVAVARAPRTPWVNPARRGHVIATAVAGALIFGGGGLLVGHAVTDHGDGPGVVRFERGPHLGGPGYGHGQLPPRQGEPRHRLPAPPATPTPAPSDSATS